MAVYECVFRAFVEAGMSWLGERLQVSKRIMGSLRKRAWLPVNR